MYCQTLQANRLLTSEIGYLVSTSRGLELGVPLRDADTVLCIGAAHQLPPKMREKNRRRSGSSRGRYFSLADYSRN